MTAGIISEKMRKNAFILYSLVSKDFKLKYRRSVLGILWSVLNPLLMMMVFTAVFSTMFRFNIADYPIYFILGNTLFTLMSDSTSSAMHSIIDSAALIKKIRIDKIVFPVEKVLFQLVNFAVSLVAVAIVMIYFRIMPTLDLLLLPFLVLCVVLFSIGLGLLLAALAVFFRDICHLWGVVLTAWTYATPIFYPVDQVPVWMQQVMQYNPMYHYITYFRDIALWGNTPSLTESALCFGGALAVFIAGLLVFKKAQNKFILYV